MVLGGITGKILRVNLTDKKVTVEATPEEAIQSFMGARGLGAYYFNKEIAPKTDPFSSDNKLIFMTGPAAATLAPGNNKVAVTFKSPMSNTYSWSLCGGFFGPELKFSGYDGLIIEGKADSPVYLWISDNKVEIKPAGRLWGKLIPETDKLIKKELRDDETIKVACIGPAGEKLNRMACITTDCYREFGRGGPGAVMGSKNLKAIAIRGSQDISAAKPEELKKLALEVYGILKKHPKAQARRTFGTVEMVEGINKLGFWSTRNFTTGYFEEGNKLIGPEMKKEVVVGDASCYACPIACGKNTAVNSKKFGKVSIEGPEYETVGLLGANCGVSSWEAIIKATEICDHYGFDTISAGATVSFAMECFEKGILTKEDTGGIDLKFGNGEALVEILEKIARREGLGDLLAEGVKIASEKIGAPELAMHIKGMPLATYDPRGCKGMALTYATSPKGAHHMVSPTMGPEIAGDRFADSGKAPIVKETQTFMAIVDSMALCSSMRFALSLEKQVELYKAVTGLEFDNAELMRVGERILNLERLINVKEGLSRKDDCLPERFTKEPMPEGASKGQVVDFNIMLDEFYAVMGWNEDGVPLKKKLEELGL
ncbi:MAG: aldehyde ferredoxin oxidoreductase family protein [Bacillota bacterium]